jgi:NhaP-type Na+/H+ or K+/H+ antiporter/mannitol/fructose-specific phosphotransferase system IIA component (Ntr-type)
MLMTLTVSVGCGILLISLSRRVGLVPIVALTVAAFILGPQGFGVLRAESLGLGLRVVVSMAMGLILFEGGLTLNLADLRKISGVVWRLLTVGVLITWLFTAFLVWLFLGFPVSHCLLYGSLVIVTGPTVINILLQRIRLTPKLHNILYWESVLIDPLGVFLAVLCFEYILEPRSSLAFIAFAWRLIDGLVVGTLGGLMLAWLFKRHIIPEELMNAFALGFAILIFGVADAFAMEAGLLAVTICGFVVGLRKPPAIQSLRRFKNEITNLMIGMLFLLLCSRLRVEQFVEWGWRGWALVAAVILFVRPFNVLISTWRQNVSLREKLFLCVLAPRGIVAASLASMVAITLSETNGFAKAQFLETFVYSVIIVTVVLQDLFAGPVARTLGVQKPDPTDWLIVGAHPFARQVAQFIRKGGRSKVILMDSNPTAVAEALNEGFVAMVMDARDIEVVEANVAIQGVGKLLVLTDNEDLNALVCRGWAGLLGSRNVHFWGMRTLSMETSHHMVVWSDLPKPSLVSDQIFRRKAELIESEQVLPHQDTLRLLMARQKDGLALLHPRKNGSGLVYLYLNMEEEELLRALQPECIAWIQPKDLTDLFLQLIGLARRVEPNLPLGTTVNSLLERENGASTAIGNGVAVPHATCPGLGQRLCILARVPDGVDFHSSNEEPVCLVFLLLSPQGDPGGHLRTLAQVARMAANPAVRNQLMRGSDPREMLEVIRYASLYG